MSEKVLICYGTRFGSSGEIAEHIGTVLKGLDIEAVVVNLKEISSVDVSSYSTVIIGSGIQAGKWTKEAKRFLEDNAENLAEKQLALFVSCLSAADPEQCDTARITYLEDVTKEFPNLHFAALGLFGGKLDPERGNFFTKRIMKSIIKRMGSDDQEPPEKVDQRNWEVIEDWTRKLVGR